MRLQNIRIVLLSIGFIDYTIKLANALSKTGLTTLLIKPDNQIQEHQQKTGYYISNELDTKIKERGRSL